MADSTPTAAAAEIVGSAYIARANGDSIVLRDFEVSLLDPAVEWLWKQTMTDVPRDSEKGHFWDKAVFDGQLKIFQRNLEASADKMVGGPPPLRQRLGYIIDRTRTDINGKFAFKHVPEGNYILYAVFTSRSSTACWFMPVAMKGSEAKHANLTNSTAHVVVNEEPD